MHSFLNPHLYSATRYEVLCTRKIALCVHPRSNLLAFDGPSTLPGCYTCHPFKPSPSPSPSPPGFDPQIPNPHQAEPSRCHLRLVTQLPSLVINLILGSHSFIPFCILTSQPASQPRMPPAPTFNYYAELQVGRDASPEDVTASYRRLARVHHPDKNPGNLEQATAAFQKVS